MLVKNRRCSPPAILSNDAQKTFLQNNDLLEYTFGFLPLEDIVKTRNVSLHFREITNESKIWCSVLKKEGLDEAKGTFGLEKLFEESHELVVNIENSQVAPKSFFKIKYSTLKKLLKENPDYCNNEKYRSIIKTNIEKFKNELLRRRVNGDIYLQYALDRDISTRNEILTASEKKILEIREKSEKRYNFYSKYCCLSFGGTFFSSGLLSLILGVTDDEPSNERPNTALGQRIIGSVLLFAGVCMVYVFTRYWLFNRPRWRHYIGLPAEQFEPLLADNPIQLRRSNVNDDQLHFQPLLADDPDPIRLRRSTVNGDQLYFQLSILSDTSEDEKKD